MPVPKEEIEHDGAAGGFELTLEMVGPDGGDVEEL
jgi:hypothetical protein